MALTRRSFIASSAALAVAGCASPDAAFARYAPSLLVLTGDNVNGQEGDVNARGKFEETVDPLLDLFRAAGIPFCVTFGNLRGAYFGHDHFTVRPDGTYATSIFAESDCRDA